MLDKSLNYREFCVKNMLVMETPTQQFNKKRPEYLAQSIAFGLGLIIFLILFNAFKDRSAQILTSKGLEGIMLVLRVIHIVAGCMCLGFGLAALLTVKGGKAHRTNGKIYFWSMAIIFVTGIAMALYHDRIFFFFIGFVSFYPAFIGYRILSQKKLSEGQKAKWFDYFILVIVACVACFGIYLGIKNINSTIGILLLIFNTLLLNHFRTPFKLYAKPPQLKGFWLITHITEMSGSYVAATTAFLVNNSQYFRFVPDIILWISPGIIGGTIITIVARRKAKQLKSTQTLLQNK
jgi:hypothetical protein